MQKTFLQIYFLFFALSSTVGQVSSSTSGLIDSLKITTGEKKLNLLKEISYDLRLQNPDSALYYAHLGLKEAQNLNLSAFEGAFYQRAGIVYRIKGEYLSAIEMYKKAEESYIASNAKEGLAGVYNSLGILFSITKNHPLAISYFERLIEIDLEQKYYPGLVLSYSNLAGIYLDRNDLNKAEQYYQMILEIYEEYKISTNQLAIWNNIGGLQLLKNNIDSALSCYQKSLKLNINDDPKSKMHSLLGIGQALKDLDPIKAEKSLQEAKELASKGDKRVRADIYLALSLTYRNQAAFEKAYENLKVYSTLKDSLFSKELIESINELEIKYESEKKELQITNEKRKNLFSYIITGALFIILFLVINRYFAQRKINRIKGEKMESEIDYKNRLLASRTIDINNFESLLNDLKAKVESSSKEEPEVLAFQLKKAIKSKLKDVNDWNAVKMHFEEVHPHFFEKISKLEPPLTANEQKHFAYIKMKISNKDIARMLNVNLSSIHVVHHRLKKKLGLKESDSLSQFIDQI